jgi:hypothetical protein
MANAVGKQLAELPGVGDHARTTEPLTLCPSSAEPGMCALDDPGALDFGQYTDQREHRASDRGREIERLTQRHQADTEVLELVEQGHQVAEVTSEPIEGGDGDEVELASAGVGHQGIETGAPLPRPAHGVIGEGGRDRPGRTRGMFPECTELILDGLVARADAGVERDAGANESATRWIAMAEVSGGV